MIKKTSFLAVACTMAVALIACLGFASEAFAAVPHMTPHGIGTVADVLINHAHLAAIPLATMRSNLSDLTKRAADKRAEVRAGLSDEELRKIEDDHAELVRQIDKLKEDIVTEERREADALRNNTSLTPAAGASAEEIRTAAETAVRAERNRTATIRSLAEKAGARELGETHAGQDTSVEAFRSLLLDHLVTEEGARGLQTSHIPARVGESDQEKRAAAIETALLHRHAPDRYELTNEARNFRGMSLLEIARDVLEARGISTRGVAKMELARMALEQRSGGLMATGDFPLILANVVNKTLRAGYAVMPQTFRPLIRTASVPDFKPVSRVQLGEAPQFEKVNEHGEFKRGSMKEGAESYAVATYGKVVGITRQVIINDDLNAFSRIPASFGVQAAQLESDLVWGIILVNAAMGDGVALFHATHKNLAASGGAISVSTVSDGRTAMAKQTGLDGKTVLGLMPSYMVVPVALQTVAEQFRGQIYPAKNVDAVPDSLKTLGIIAEPRLDSGVHNAGIGIDVAGSATAWYLAGNPGIVDLIELAYLDGNEGVYTETRTGFDVDGVEVKVRMDVGAKALDWRNVYKNAGA
jgi:phage major head subunit gpT-like protein